jgi:membrane protein
VGAVWRLMKETVSGFIEDNVKPWRRHGFLCGHLDGPVLLIVIAIAGLVFGHDAAQNALTAQLTGLLGQQSAEMLQTAIKSASGKTAGIWATIIGAATLLITASAFLARCRLRLTPFGRQSPEALPSRASSARGPPAWDWSRRWDFC